MLRFEDESLDIRTRIWALRDWPKNNPSHIVGGSMEYRCETTSVAGFVQQLAVGYIARGYIFYVTGNIPAEKDPRAIDEKLIGKYSIQSSKATRARRKALGLSNVQYLRSGRSFVLLATPGKHPFFEQERGLIRDVREMPIKFGGYAISYRGGHPHVRIEQTRYLELKAYFLELALHRQVSALEEAFSRLPYEPYAPIRGQLLGILRAVNQKRKTAQYELVSPSCIRLRRVVVCPFKELAVESAAA
jgi:hypothetical protein